VYGVFMLELAQTAIATHDAVVVFGYGFNNDVALNQVHLLWMTIPLIGGLVGCTGQLFFAYRIILAKFRIIGIIIALLSITATVSALYLAHAVRGAKALVDVIWSRNMPIAWGIWNGCGAICDAVIATSMTCILSRPNRKNQSTQVLINKFLRIIVETGALTATASITNIIIFTRFKSAPTVQSYFPITAFAISKLYAITLLSFLNSRLCVEGGRYLTRPEAIIVDAFLYNGPRADYNWLTGNGMEIRIETDTVRRVWKNEKGKVKVENKQGILQHSVELQQGTSLKSSESEVRLPQPVRVKRGEDEPDLNTHVSE